MTPAHFELLRRLALNDELALNQVMSGRRIEPPLLDEKTSALVRVAAMVALESGGPPSYQWAVDAAHASGAEDEEIVQLLLAVAPIVGVARVNAAAPNLASALGYSADDL